ncbi:bifunctional diaminohydroxyphosphoribosylaminopyrimidine deaminase/5-amino-6-(5-phosphoribosylamino)uracil reductase RibD [Micromonospora sp. AMSO12t]|uniref:bifunctional diaminohydroxyphosphoribosylaminopyrimidine deaminase/5-amino-6-(5-phosphoribosylamino)uracil reductase RibD n=1 Tax=unclassified Micromonospora TaxID=2617518 RepID=UPI00124BAD43|nr:bifunctional diaminohydroxyphosphoribosylaminopyrimidine deaminase/5-amino-6-(5-phosphoribosylamino)uracil reductase RibD [Micromonospora sp. AMSO12t]KAB1157487.1 bifunctional diaminohydroxyphosphoribosylaminopyrimidine deaminase/5-amino-6-(5-phosphoribosylamino)uracil reductase RibD [Micromonospora sp. AMSO12t]
MASDAELAAMRHAITLSSFGLGTTSPNPPVGCVILDRNGATVGTGYHRRKGEAHAEANALKAAGAAARGGTAVVTLEPCNHTGVTPACRQELINAGITRVVISIIDPTSRGDGGAAVLAAHGIDVETNVLPNETLTVLGPWLTATRRRRPYLIWAYVLNAKDSQHSNDQLVADLRSRADLVHSGKALEEGIPGGHAPEHFTLPDDPSGDLHQWISTCYATGSRAILAVGADSNGLHVNLDCVDEIVVAVGKAPPASGLAAATIDLTPAGFEWADISPSSTGNRIRLRRSEHSSLQAGIAQTRMR